MTYAEVPAIVFQQRFPKETKGTTLHDDSLVSVLFSAQAQYVNSEISISNDVDSFFFDMKSLR